MTEVGLARVDVGSVQDFPVGKFQRLDIAGKDVWAVRTPGDRFWAIKNTCPHQGAPICEGEVGGTYLPSEHGELVYGCEYRIIRCPHHAYEYDLETGLPAFTGGKGRLVRYNIDVEGGRVLVSLRGR